ncbi:MAG TPA: TonB-dependent receptor, partial [Rhodothermia bacterium]|nr:TonB-dependent receptor [Rhodothermia bacterium]
MIYTSISKMNGQRTLLHVAKWRRTVLIALAVLLHGSIHAGTTGKISGRVVDADNGQGLPGVNVLIVGTTLGATTDVDGYYSIIQVPPDTYSVRASFIGYAGVTTEEVRVVVDKTTTLNFSLREAVVEGEEIVVTAERPIVQMDRTTTTAVVDGAQLEALPVTNVQDAINIQAGVVDGHFRGGRQAEVAYLLNGVPITNPFTNQRSFEIEQNMVQSLEVISGVFNAEYGQALSGVVNIVTKGIPRRWEGSFLGYAGAIASDRELEFVDRTLPAGSGLSGLDFVRDTVSYSEAAEFPNKTDVQVSLGGPIIADKLGLRISTRYLDDNGYRLGRNLFSPDDVSFGLNTGAPPQQWFIESTGDRSFVSLDAVERFSLNGKLNYGLTPSVRFDYNLFVQADEYLRHLHAFKYVPSGINLNKSFSQTHILGARITLGTNAFVNASYGYLRDDFQQELFSNDCTDSQISTGSCELDERYVQVERNTQQGANAFQVGGNELYTNDNFTESHTIVADYTRQASRVHQLKVGALARLHRLDNKSFGIERSFRTGDQPRPSPDQVNRNLLAASPVELSVYLQDKMEFTGLIVNAGLRFDYFEPDYRVPIDLTQSDLEEIPDPDNPGGFISNRKEAEVETQFSPRVGIAFPISSTGVMRFSAGMFFQ